MPAFPPRLPDETPRAYAAFVSYCELGSARSLDKLVQKYHKSRPIYARWSAQHAWVSRVATYDDAALVERAAALDAARREEVERLRRQSQEDATLLRALARGIGAKLAKRLQSLDEHAIEPQQIAGLARAAAAGLEAAANLEAAALGVSDVLAHLERVHADIDTDEPGQAAQRVGG